MTPDGRGAMQPAVPAGRARTAIAMTCLLLPWVNPFAAGPSSWVAPWLFSLVCAALVYAAGPRGLPHLRLTLVLAGAAGWAMLRSGWTPETLALAGSLAVIWMTAAWSAAAGRERVGRAVAQAWLAAAVLSTAAALLQYFGLADRVAPWVNASEAGEAFANLRQRNQFASLTAIGLAALLWLAPARPLRWPAVAAAVWLAAGTAVTTSRTGLLQLLLLGAATWWWCGAGAPRTRLWLVALGGYVAAAALLPPLAESVTGVPANSLWGRVSGSNACASRLVLWSNVLHLVGERPWLGWGWGELDFAHYANLYQGPRFCDILDNAHNLPLHVAVELGVPAALAVCAALAAAVWHARPWRERDDVRQLAWIVVLVIGVHSLLEYPLWYGPFQMAFGAALGVLWSPARPSRPASAASASAVLLALATVAGAGYAAWDYWRASQVYLPPERRAAGWRDDPLARVRGSWLFRSQVRFAELTLRPLTRANAAQTYEDASALLHFSPEPPVIEKLIDSAAMLGREDEAMRQLARYRAAFPQAYAAWSDGYRRGARR